MSDTLTDDQLDWTHKFTGLDPRQTPGQDADAATSAAPPEPPAPDPNTSQQDDPNTSQQPVSLVAQNGDPTEGKPPEDIAPAGGGGGLKYEVSVEIPVVKAKLGYVEGEGAIKIASTIKPAGTDPDSSVKFADGKVAIEAKIKEKLSENVSFSGGIEASGEKGAVTVGIETKLAHGVTAKFDFSIVKVDGKNGEIKFATLKWENEYPIVKGEETILGVAVEYEGTFSVSIELSPEWVEISKYILEKLGISVAEDTSLGGSAAAILDVAIPAALALVAIGTIAAVADAFVQRSQNKDMRVGVNTARASLMGGLNAGLSGADSAGGDALYAKGWEFGHQAYTAAIAKLMRQPDLPPPDEITAAARNAARKAVGAWKGVAAIDHEIRWAYFRNWVENNHGVTTFMGAAHDAVLSCFGIPMEPITGEHMSYWAGKSELPHFMKS